MTQQGWAPLPAPPAAAPPPYFVPPPPVKPSGIYKALGVVQATLGAAGVLYALFSLIAVSAVFFTMRSASSVYTPAELAVMYGRSGMNIVTGVMLVVAGLGIFRAKRWSRTVGIVYAVTSLTETVGGGLLNFLVVLPASTARTPGLTGSGQVEAIMIATALFGALVASVLPIVTLVALLSRRAKDELDQ